MTLSINGEFSSIAFESGVSPGEKVGKGVFPALSGSQETHVIFNFGHNMEKHPLKHLPANFEPWASVSSAQREQVNCLKYGILIIRSGFSRLLIRIHTSLVIHSNFNQ
jgi:hypothetical protein